MKTRPNTKPAAAKNSAPPRIRSRLPIPRLIEIMAILRSPQGCPWDREQDHRSIRFHAVEEVYEMIDAIESRDDRELAEELGDLLLQVVFHCQLASERGAFSFQEVTSQIVDKLIRRHPHVFGDAQAKSVDAVWAQWEKIKRREKQGTTSERKSALDGVPRHLPALLRAQKLVKKARKASLETPNHPIPPSLKAINRRTAAAQQLWSLAQLAHEKGWNLEALLREECARQERRFRKTEALQSAIPRPPVKKVKARHAPDGPGFKA